MAFATAQQTANAQRMTAVLNASVEFQTAAAAVCALATATGAVNRWLGVAETAAQANLVQSAWAAIFPGTPYPAIASGDNPFANWGVIFNAGTPADGQAIGLPPGCIPYSIVPDPSLVNILAAVFAPVLNILEPGSGSVVAGAAGAASGPDQTYVPPIGSGAPVGSLFGSPFFLVALVVAAFVLLERE